jgi:ubiquinone/menaquinone biosynthesis C-methylase UbiE
MIETYKQAIETQYAQSDLYDSIIDSLKAKGVSLNEVTRSHLSGVDEFHIRGEEVSYEIANQVNLRNKKVLDIGCGLGGPCRMLSERYNCETYGIDMSPDYIEAAKKLSALVSANNASNFVVGDALNLPFEDGSFDVVWTQHVQMNIEDKRRFYSEINRVLANGGSFIYYDIFKHYPIEINFPVPWANDSSVSFLQTIESMDAILRDLNFYKHGSTDQTDKGLEFLENMMYSKKLTNSSVTGLNLLLGEETEEKFSNVLNALQCGKIELQSGVYKKP